MAREIVRQINTDRELKTNRPKRPSDRLILTDRQTDKQKERQTDKCLKRWSDR